MGKSIALIMPKSTFLEIPMTMQPLGLFYLASRLESMGHKTNFFDLNVDEIPPDNYDEFWVSATSPQIAEAKKVWSEIKNYKGKKVIGGAGSWANPDSFMEIGYDLVVGGEADEPENMRKILDTNKGYLMLPVSKTLDWVLPPIRRWSYKYNSYLSDLNGNKRRCTTFFNSRGCPLECAFCESGRHGVIWDRLTRFEPMDIIEYQLKESKKLGYSAIAYYDDIKIMNRKRMAEELELIKKYGMIWRCFLRSDIICKQGGYDYLKELRDGGLVEIFVGVESADNQIKDNIHKKTTIEQDTLIVQWCKELKIRCKTSLIMGLPGESRESIETTLKWVLENRPDRVQWGRLIPFPGTPLTKNPQDYDLIVERNIDDDWFYMGHNETSHGFVGTSNMSAKELDDEWHRVNKILEEMGISK